MTTVAIDNIPAEQRTKSANPMRIVYAISLGFTLIFMVLNDYWLSGLGLGLCLFLFLRFIYQMGRTVPVLELTMLMAGLQWILGAFWSYRLDFEHFKYYMYVDEPEYMDIVVPGTFAFIIGTLSFYPKYSFQVVNESLKKLVVDHPKIAYYLIAVGVISPFIENYAPAALGFVFYLMANLKYIGVALVLFKENNRRKWRIFYVVMALTLLASLRNGMFHDLLLWSALMFSFVALKVNMGFFPKLSLVLGGLFFAFLLQGIKSQYRDYIASGVTSSGSRVEVFYDLMTNELDHFDDLFTESYLGVINVRLNQGWIISAIIDNVPAAEPFAKGETIEEAVYASIVPRIFDPGKEIAGGRENFERFTGLYLGAHTSMGTSILGEAYANYGKEGSWLFMFLWGVALSLVYRYLIKYGNGHPIIHLFLPLIFLQVIKAETELVVVLNHLVKSMILVFVMLWFVRKYLKWEV